MDQQFVGRTSELERLNEIYEHGPKRTCSLLGRRRIGKSTLLEKFFEGKSGIMIQFSVTSERTVLSMMSKAIASASGRPAVGYDTIIDALDDIADICRERKQLIIFDEFPYLLASVPEASSAVQRFIDTQLDKTDSMLVICGSSVSVMENETEDPSRPLYGRFYNRMELGPLSFAECMQFHPGMDELDRVRTYLVLGGVPIYHVLSDADTFRGQMESLFLRRNPLLQSEVEGMFRREFRRSDEMMRIVSVISDGSVTLKEISEKAGLSGSTCTGYLETLASVGMIDEAVPMLGAPSRPHYRISDSLVAFHFSVLDRYSYAVSGPEADVFGLMEHDIDTFLGQRFEYLCRDYIRTHYLCTEVGSWWGRAGDEQRDIDVVASVRQGREKVDLLVECKFRRRRVGASVFYELRDTASGLHRRLNERYMLISVSGFDESLEDLAESGEVVLIGLDHLLDRMPAPVL